ncbi:MAG: SMP-30/gluconolactonase/LRE family protein, partial [Sphingomonas sp.]
IAKHSAELARMGGTLSVATQDRLWPDKDDPARIAFARLSAGNGETYATPELFAQVPAEYRLVEGIAWDEKTQRLFIGTVIEGRLAYRDPDGSWHEVPVGNPRGGLFGMAVDAPRRLLWIATGSVEQTAVAGERMTGLIAIDLDTLKVVRRVPIAPGGAGAAGDLVIAAGGTVYVSNVVSGAIHRCKPGCAVLEDFLPAGTFPNPQGMAMSDDGKHLYIADYVTGLWVADPVTGTKTPIAIREPMMLDGIDGLMMDGYTLFAIQNGTRPLRVMRFVVSRSGDAIVSSQKWIAVPAGAGEPTLGVIRPPTGDLLYVGDGQWERYGPGGVLKDGQPLRPTPILVTGLADIVT